MLLHRGARRGHTLTGVPTIEIHPSWYEHPLVAGAIARSQGDPVDVVKNLYRGLQWLDQHADGKSFDEALALRHGADSLEEFRQRMLDEGNSVEEVGAIISYRAPDLGSLKVLPLQQRTAIRERIGFLSSMSWPLELIANHMGVSVDSVRNQLCGAGGRVLNDEQQQIAQTAIRTSNSTAAREFGVAVSTVSRLRQCYISQQEKVSA